MSYAKRLAFSLVELSIVLVIFGLLVGGVLTGKSLIESASLRSQLAQIDEFRTAVNIFRDKYFYLPGDIPNPTASGLGLSPRGVTAGTGNGDGLLEAPNGGVPFGTYQTKGETALFWRDLSQLGLINGNYNVATINDQTVTPPFVNLSPSSTPNLNVFFPAAKINNNWILVYSFGGNNYMGIIGRPVIQGNGPAFSYPGLTVSQAFTIDTKIDDGKPQSGKVTDRAMLNNTNVEWSSDKTVLYGRYGYPPGVAEAAVAGSCHNNGNNAAAEMVYTTTINQGNDLNCSLGFSF